MQLIVHVILWERGRRKKDRFISSDLQFTVISRASQMIECAYDKVFFCGQALEEEMEEWKEDENMTNYVIKYRSCACEA